jgi:hypothetical protein
MSTTIRRVIDGLIDCKEGSLQLSALAQVIGECTYEAR